MAKDATTTEIRVPRVIDRLSGSRTFVITCYVVAAFTFSNWFAHFAISMSIGGSATGTVPAAGQFFVTSHGHHTAVDERTWLISLFYTTATMLEAAIGFPAFMFLGLRKQFQDARRKGGEIGRRNAAIGLLVLKIGVPFFLLWSAGWFYAIIRDFLISWNAYCRL
jgi:fucose permease